MEQYPIQGALPEKKENGKADPVSLDGTFRGKYRGFAVFLICCALLLAAFAVSAIWMRNGGEEWLNGLGSFLKAKEEETESAGDTPHEAETQPIRAEFDSTPVEEQQKEPIPENAVAVIPMDLSAPSLGKSYIHNETPYTPNVDELLGKYGFGTEITAAPLVLILHTHTSESYLPAGTEYITEAVGDLTYCDDATQNILSVGEVLCRTLNENGIPAIHCETVHDSPTFSGSYSRSAETVKRYLAAYPSIEYVIDLHRDSVTTSDGEIVRSIVGEGEDAVAQVMAVIGTDGNGTDHENWEANLALALSLREALNQEENVCRPVSLRNASYNQELAKYSLLLEIGTSANSLEEAQRAAVLVGEALAKLLQAP